MKNKILVVGGGAAGIMAAIQASKKNKVYLFEKMPRLGLKILVSGKGRCNVTNAGPTNELIKAFGKNGKFLYHSFCAFSNEDLIKFLERIGVETKVERGNRVFPVSNHSKDVLNALKKELVRRNVSVELNKPIKKIIIEDRTAKGIILQSGEKIFGDAVIITTGGKSFPGLGTTGDGFKILREAGHTIQPLYPALVPLIVREKWVSDLQGLSLRNVKIKAKYGKRNFSHFGDMLFTQRGISGPIVLTLSSEIVPYIKKSLPIEIDLKPALSGDILDKRLLRDFIKFSNKTYKNALNALLPNSLIPVFVMLSNIVQDKKCNEITKNERKKILHLLKHFPLTVTDTEGFTHAIVTKGGIDLKEINPKTMQSKLIKRLYVAGEVLDLDAITGGYNLQAAFSTGFVAGISSYTQ